MKPQYSLKHFTEFETVKAIKLEKGSLTEFQGKANGRLLSNEILTFDLKLSRQHMKFKETIGFIKIVLTSNLSSQNYHNHMMHPAVAK